MADPIVSKPDHGEKIILQGNEGQEGMASPRLQLFFDDITLILNNLTTASGGSIEPSDFLPSSIIYRPSTGTVIFPATINENEFIGRPLGGEIQGLSFQESWGILGNGTTHVTINDTGGANDFTVESNTSSKMFVVQGSNNRVSIARDGWTGTDGMVHVLNSFAGENSQGPVEANAAGDDLVLEHDYFGGMSLLEGNNGIGNIFWGSPNWGNAAGNLWFFHDIDFGGLGAPTMGANVMGDTFWQCVSDQVDGATSGIFLNPLQNTNIDFQYNSVNEAPFMRIDQTAGVGRMGLSQGVSLGPTDGILHIHRDGSAGAVTALADFNHIVLESPTTVGMTFLGGEFSEMGLKFGSSVGVTGPGDGSIVYIPDVGSSVGRFIIRTGAGAGQSQRMWIDTNEVVINPSPFFQSTAFRIGGSQFNDNFIYAKTSPAGGNRFSVTDANIQGTQGLCHIIRQGLSLGSAPGNGLDMIFDGSGNHGITFLATDVEEANIHFVSPSNLNNFIRWSNANVNFQFFVNNAQALMISQGEVAVNDTGLATVAFRVEADTSTVLLHTTPTGGGRVGISDASVVATDGLLHVIRGGLSGTLAASTVVDAVVIEGNSETGLSVLVPDNTFADIAFGSPTWGNLGGNIYFDTDTTFGGVGLPGISFDVNGTTFLTLRSDEFDGTSTAVLVNATQSTLIDFQVNTFGSAPFLRIDATNNRMGLSQGVSFAPTDGILHIHDNASAGVITAATGADSIVLEGVGPIGLTMLTDNATGVGTLAWGDPTNGNDTTHLQWTPASSALFLKVKGVNVYNYGAFGTTFNPDQTNQRIQFQSQTSTTMAIFNGTNGKVGFSDASIFPTDGLIHIIQGGLSGSVSAPTASDGLVFESNASTGLAFLVPVGAIVTQTWGDPGDNDRFVQEMDSNTNTMTWRINNQTLVSFDFTGGPGGEFVLNESGLASFDIRFESDNSLRMFYLDSSINMVSFSQAGIAGTDGTVHIINADAGAIAASGNGDELVLESTGEMGLSFLTDNAGFANIYYGNPGSGSTVGHWRWDAANATLEYFQATRSNFLMAPLENVFNEGGLSNIDLRVESDNNTKKLWVDASADEAYTRAGGSTHDQANAKLRGVFTAVNTGVGTTAVTTEEILHRFILRAFALGANDQGVRIRAWGNTAANANNKTVKVKFGATVLYDSTAVAANAEEWFLEFDVYRTGAATQDAQRHFSLGIDGAGGVTLVPTLSTAAETLTGDVNIDITGQNGTAAANDIVAEGYSVEYI